MSPARVTVNDVVVKENSVGTTWFNGEDGSVELTAKNRTVEVLGDGVSVEFDGGVHCEFIDINGNVVKVFPTNGSSLNLYGKERDFRG